MTDWWKRRAVYQVYPRSFQDSDGDGYGDLEGITNRLEHIKKLGAGIVWLSPVYLSPDADNGYDIADYTGINRKFGTMADMDAMLAEAKRLDLKIVMDLVINHTSDEHAWFEASRDKNSPYRDYYIWCPGKNGGPPNNWTGFFGGSVWELDDKSGEYYLHLFDKKQPDLNWHNPKVYDEICDILRFWLDKGVSGFRCDVINILYKTSLENGKKSVAITGREHYLSQEGCHDILRRLRRDVLDKYDCFTVGETVFVDTKTAHDLCDPSRGELDMLFSFEHMETDCFGVKWFLRRFSPARFGRTLARWQNELAWNANYLENHDQPRCVSRFGDDAQFHDESAKMLCMLLLSLRGTPYIYEGQEIGMTNFDFSGMDELQDVESRNIYALAGKLHLPKAYRWKMIRLRSRDNARTPMQWDDTENAGFSSGKPWLGVNRNYPTINVAAQRDNPFSVLSFYKKMLRTRAGSETLIFGSFELIKASNRLFAFRRVYNGETLTVILSFSRKPQKFSAAGEVVLDSYQKPEYDGTLEPYEGVILR